MADRTLAVEATIKVGGVEYRVVRYAQRQALFEVGGLDCEIVKDDDTAPDPESLAGDDVTFKLTLTDGTVYREYAGSVVWAERAPRQDDVPHVALRVAPKMWNLTKRADCRIFRKKSVVTILHEVLSGAGVVDADWQGLTGSYAKRPHVTQYRETDLDFVMRLCAEEGIYFWVHGTNGKDTVHFADNPKGVGPISGTEALVYREVFGEHPSGDYVMRVEQTRRVVSDKVTLRDFDPRHPKVKLEATVESVDPGAHELEVYQYPGRFTDAGRGHTLAEVLRDAIQAERTTVRGVVANLALEPGKRFSITQHPYDPINQEYLIVSVELEGSEQRAFAIDGASAQKHEFSYVCRFTAVPTKDNAYRPPRRPSTVVMPGLQSAITVGPGGEEINTDAGGNVKVQFHWDRIGKHNNGSSRWLRTSQVALGGGMLIPRVGWEVAIRFNEGDADNPYVMSRLYNGATPPPYELPKHKGRSSLQTATTPGGGSVNEFHMSDEKGQESFFMNASKDMTVQVNNNTTESVGNNSARSVVGNHKLSINNSSSASVGANQSLTVDGTQTVHVETFMVDQVTGAHVLHISGDRTMMIGGDHKRDVTGDSKLTIGGMMLDAVIGDVTDATLANMQQKVGGALVELTAGGRSYTVGGSRDEKTAAIKIIAAKGGRAVDVTGNYKQTVGGAVILSVTKDHAETAAQTYMEVAAGAHIVKADSVSYEAETMLSLVMGASTITMLPAMVAIAGISIKCDGDVSDTASLISDN